MSRDITVGIDVGTHATRVAILEFGTADAPQILGTGISGSRGVRHGYITNTHDAAESIKQAVSQAEQATGIKVKRAAISIGGISLGSIISTGSTVISKADGEVTDLDVSKAIAESEEKSHRPNRKIIETIPIAFFLDGEEVLGHPEGMRGSKLEVHTLSVTCLEQHLEDLLESLKHAGISATSITASPVATSYVTLTEKQKIAGCLLINIGAETVSAAVFENGTLFSLHVFSIGSTDITNDIALGLKIPLEEAESLKVGDVLNDHPKKQLKEIIDARLEDIFELISKYLKRIRRSELLPAGVIITGGGSHIEDISATTKDRLNLPARVGKANVFKNVRSKVHDPSWFVALGLCLAERDTGTTYTGHRMSIGSSLRGFFGSLGKQLLP